MANLDGRTRDVLIGRDKEEARALVPKIVGAVQAASSILRTLAGSSPLRLVDVARATGLNGSTALNILYTLGQDGLVRHDPACRRYGLGERLLELAACATDDGRWSRVVATMDDLARELGVTILLWKMLDRREARLVAASGPTHVELSYPVDACVPSLQGAVGRLFAGVAGFTEAELRAQYDALGWDAAPGLETWLGEIAEARRTGFARDRGNNNLGLYGLAVSIDGAAHMLALVTVGSMADAEAAKIVPRLKKAAYEIAPFL